MSAEVLRRAAVLMREHAEGSSPSPWIKTVFPKAVPGVYSQTIEDTREFDPEIARTLDESDAEHIASWHPAVALAVADLLDVWVDRDLLSSSGTLADERSAILAVASTYLGVSA